MATEAMINEAWSNFKMSDEANHLEIKDIEHLYSAFAAGYRAGNARMTGHDISAYQNSRPHPTPGSRTIKKSEYDWPVDEPVDENSEKE